MRLTDISIARKCLIKKVNCGQTKPRRHRPTLSPIVTIMNFVIEIWKVRNMTNWIIYPFRFKMIWKSDDSYAGHFKFGICRTMPNLTKIGVNYRIKFGTIRHCLFDSILSRIRDVSAARMAVLLHMEDAFKVYVRQVHAVLGFFVLHHWKIALNSGSTRKDGC